MFRLPLLHPSSCHSSFPSMLFLTPACSSSWNITSSFSSFSFFLSCCSYFTSFFSFLFSSFLLFIFSNLFCFPSVPCLNFLCFFLCISIYIPVLTPPHHPALLSLSAFAQTFFFPLVRSSSLFFLFILFYLSSASLTFSSRPSFPPHSFSRSLSTFSIIHLPSPLLVLLLQPLLFFIIVFLHLAFTVF